MFAARPNPLVSFPGPLIEKLGASPWIPRAINLGALLLLTSALAQWTWRVVDPPALPVPAATTAMSAPASSEPDLPRLLSAHLFGVADPGRGALSPQQLPLSSLNLVLTGVIARGNDSFALIRIDGAPEEPIGIGQEITAGARLRAVYPDRIILERSGALESLILQDNDVPLAAGSVQTAPPPAAPAPQGTAHPDGRKRFTVERETLSQQMQRPEVLSQALVVPNTEGGLLVREIQAGSLYQQLGLRAGDVIRSVNGQPVSNMDDVIKVYQQLGGVEQARNVVIEVTRAGKTETLHYQFQ